MFAMVHGAWPRVTKDGVDLDALEADVEAGRATEAALADARERLVRDVIGWQVEAGLDLVTDGQVRWADPDRTVLAAVAAVADGEAEPGFLVDAWRAAAALTERPVAQTIPGPYTLGHRVAEMSAATRANVTIGIAHTLAGELRALADAGCPMVVVEEPAATIVGADPADRALFIEAHERLLSLVPELHAMLAISGGSALGAGAGTIFAAPYRSHLFDLIEGPDDWSLVRAAPAERGIVCGALRAGPRAGRDQSPELVWAAQYAASSMGRGIARVGLSNSTSLRRVSRRSARTAATGLARAARFAIMPRTEAIAAGLDARTFNTLPSMPVSAAPRSQRRSEARGTRDS